MPVSNNLVVPNSSLVTEQQFQLALADGLSRAVKKIGRKAVAKQTGISIRGLDKIFAGGTTHPKRLFDALAIDDSVLDAICELYGRKLVPNDSALDRTAAPPVCAALQKIVIAESDGVKSHSELLDMEPELIAAEKTIAGLRGRIASFRKPTVLA